MNLLKYIHKIYILLSKSNRSILLILCLFFINSTIELFGLSILIPYFDAVLNGNDDNFILLLIQKNFNTDAVILIFSLFVVLIFLLKFILGICVNISILRFSYGVQSDLRIKLFNCYQNLSYLSFIRRKSSYYIDSITRMTGIYQGSLLMLMKVISDGFVSILLIAYLLSKAWFYVLTLFFVLVPIIYLYDKLIQKNIYKYGKEVILYNESIVDIIKTFASGFKVIKTLKAESDIKHVFDKNCQDYSRVQSLYLGIAQMPRYFFELLIVIFLVLLIIVINTRQPASSNTFEIISLFGIVAIRIKPIISVISEFLSNIRFSSKNIDLLYQDYITFEKYNLQLHTIENNTDVSKFDSITLSNIVFAYDKKNNFKLNKINFDIKIGESVGIIGPSGCGKSTLMDILLGVIKPDKGGVTLKNSNTELPLKEFSDSFGYLPQDSFIIPGTIRDNICLGSTKNSLTDDDIYNLLEIVNLKSFVHSLSSGLDTEIGEGGCTLSGGQRQRICIARILLLDRPIIVLDEATSAIDNQNEAKIIDELNKIKKGKTLIIIAHRLSTVKSCDKIVKMDNGELINIGSPKEILN